MYPSLGNVIALANATVRVAAWWKRRRQRAARTRRLRQALGLALLLLALGGACAAMVLLNR